MSGENILLSLASLFFLGVGAQWLSWRMNLPSIVTLLAVGLAVGPLTGLLHPEQLLGELLHPLVSLSVAVILFEGGLTLRLSELKECETLRSVRRLVLIGALVTWALVTGLAIQFLGFKLELALLLGAILVVTGPTVILPLLRQVGIGGRVRSILKWEGMINDPVGAVLAVVVFEAIRGGYLSDFSSIALSSFLTTIFLAFIGGAAVARLLAVCLKKFLVPDHLQAPLALGFALLLYGLCDMVQPESGLAAVTIMGLVLAHAKDISLRHIRRFKESLSVLLISTLFVVLSANIEYESLASVKPGWVVFTCLVIFVVRPVAVLLSTAGSGLTWQEKVYLSAIGPRGIVAAAIASVFSLELSNSGYQGVESLVMITFLVIGGSVVVSGVVAAPLSQYLDLAQDGKGTLLMVGAHDRARCLARALVDGGVSVLMVDSNAEHVSNAKRQDLEAICGDILSSDLEAQLDFSDIGALLAVLPNDEVNTLAVIKFREELGAANVYRILSKRGDHPDAGRPFGGLSREELNRSWDDGLRPRLTEVSEENPPARPLVVIREEGDWQVIDGEQKLSDGDTVVALEQRPSESP